MSTTRQQPTDGPPRDDPAGRITGEFKSIPDQTLVRNLHESASTGIQVDEILAEEICIDSD